MADKYDDIDFYRWVRTYPDGDTVVSRPHVSLPYVKGHVSQFSTNRYGPQPTFTYKIQKLVPVIEWDVREGEYVTFIQTPRAELKWEDVDV